MSRAPRSREQFVARLLRESDPAAARALARTSRRLVDDDTARIVLEEFAGSVRQGRAPVAAASRAASAAAAVAAVCRTPFCRAVAHRTAGIVGHLGGRPIEARRRLLLAAEMLEEAGELLDAGDVHRTLIDVQMLAGDYAAARRAARRARTCYDRAGDAGGRRLGGLALNVGNLHHRRDELREALASYSLARRHLKRAGEKRLVATVDYNRGNVLATLDRVEDAREHYRKALAVFDSEKLPALVAQADSALATLDLLEGRLDDCIERLECVKQRQAALHDREGVAHSELDQAEAFLRLNRPEEAKRAARGAESYFRGRGFDAESALGAGVLAGAELQAGRPSRAVHLFRRGCDLERRRRNPIGVAMLEIGLAQAEICAGRPARGLEIARRSAGVSRRNRLRSREARALAVGAEAALRSGRSALARRWAARALTIARNRRDYRVQLAALLVLARIEKAAGRKAHSYRRLLSAERCMEKLRRGITTEDSRLAFAVDKSEVYEALILNRLERGGRAAVRQALVFAERGKARALAERLAEGPVEMLGAGSPAARRLMGRLKRVEQELALAESRLEDPESRTGVRGSAVSRVASLTDSRMRTLGRLLREDPQRAILVGAAPPDPWQGVRSLGANELVLEYTEAGGHFHLFCIDRDGVEAHPHIVSVERVRDVADLLRFNLGKGVLGEGHSERFGRFIESALRGYLARLYEMLLAPVADRLDDKIVRIIPHGLLHGLPFHAMECGGIAAVDRSMISYAPSLAVLGLLSRRRSRSGAPPLVLGVPNRSAPLIDEEVDAIRRHLPLTRVFRGSAATSEAVRLSEDRPPLLHVACHGFYAEHSRLTGALRLGDAWLSLPEIYTLRGTAELVVLSGCETGRGTVYSGDEWVGLVRGFLQAGARSVVASLWEVNDRSAVNLMSDFYRRLAAGSTVVEALTMAQRRARREDPIPLRWAPFMVIGDPALKIAMREAA